MLPEANKELERFNTRIVAMYPFPAQVLFCRQPIASLDELKGKKVRTHGGSLNDFISAIGGQPTGIGFPEVYGALERGVVDCAVTGTASGNGARWYEVTKGMYALPLCWAVAAYYRQHQLVEQARPAGPRLPRADHEGGRATRSGSSAPRRPRTASPATPATRTAARSASSSSRTR